MKPLIVKVFALAILFGFSTTQAQAAEDSLRFGAGMGFAYSGLGGYAAYTQEQQIFAFSAGATSIGGYGPTFGAGVSWLRTDWFGDGSNKRHAAGLYLGAVSSENYYRADQSSINRRTIWGGGPVYQYYQNGSHQPGFVGGAAILFGDARYRTETSFGLSVGYQF